MLESLLPNIGIGAGVGSVSVASVFLYLYKQERATNKSLVDSMFQALQNNTAAMTELKVALNNKSICPLTGTDALAVLDSLRKR